MLEDKVLLQFYAGLTKRKQEVLALAAAGLTNNAIAEKLVIESCVVASHLSDIYGELATLEGVPPDPKRYVLISLFAHFFERHPYLRKQ